MIDRVTIGGGGEEVLAELKVGNGCRIAPGVAVVVEVDVAWISCTFAGRRTTRTVGLGCTGTSGAVGITSASSSGSFVGPAVDSRSGSVDASSTDSSEL